ncbi:MULTISPECIES: TspO/MBR family protein [Streptomyces]|uniref:TspO/MBR family protein n=1 Tax=Streptomyces TaxID=1883 RepID=UPI00052426E4|nr:MULTISPECIES: TspO/MBR family protein [unclassified Streptomyces]MDF9874416.1 benzodiazapine receptor [Streptomyces pratensis]MDX2621772.1 tryptophan-rich sensory protein [Streptomyces sp. WI03-5b]MYT61529.1 tryptophan-rich sensory protein [Streptomyces sp. SID7834]WJY29629.1 TspO/MBR family protein [Streptomyces sp. P9-2B-1]
MKSTSESSKPGTHRKRKSYAAAAAAVAATAVVGARAVDADSAWYKALDKPQWQPPSWAFGVVWTPLYASVAWAAGRGLSRARGSERSRLAAGVGVNLVLNAAWNQLFFRRRSPQAGLAGTLLLDVSNVHLIRRMAATDRAAAAALTPYAAWCLFATALNVSLVRRNPRRRDHL